MNRDEETLANAMMVDDIKDKVIEKFTELDVDISPDNFYGTFTLNNTKYVFRPFTVKESIEFKELVDRDKLSAFSPAERTIKNVELLEKILVEPTDLDLYEISEITLNQLIFFLIKYYEGYSKKSMSS